MNEHVLKLLDQYYDDELNAGKRIRVKRHLEECEACRAALETLTQLSAVLNETPPAPTLTPPDRFVARVRLQLIPRRPLAERQWVKLGGVAFPLALVGAWIFVQVVWLFITAALIAVELGWGARLGLQPVIGVELIRLLSGRLSNGMELVRAFFQFGGALRWLVIVPLQLMVFIAALYGLWLLGLYRWQAALVQGRELVY
jgi:predicted anti-sigma-YlaC factor YlaD